MSKPIQQQVARLVWHANYSFKRSLSAVTNAAASAMPSPNPNYVGQGALNKNWIHPPDALIYGRVEYTVKLLGDVPVEQAKGTEVIKDAIQVLRFNLSVKKAAGFKLQKVELHVNVDGVNIVDAKTKMVLHKYPLHRISFCADDKTDKRLFAFIARQQSPSSNTEGRAEPHQRHHCYVFLSDKLAEEITLTIGEAFDLAYRRFLDNNGRDLELKKQLIVLRKRVNNLEMENAELKRQLAQQQRNVANSYQHSLIDIVPPTPPQPPAPASTTASVHQQSSTINNNTKKWENFSDLDTLDPVQKSASVAPPLPTTPVPQSPRVALMQIPPPSTRKPHHQQRHASVPNVDVMHVLSSNGPDVGRRLENLRLTELEDIFDQEFDPRAGEGILERKNPFMDGGGGNTTTNGETSGQKDPQPTPEPTSEDFEMAISMIDSRLADMRDGFSTGISFGKDDFHVNDFDQGIAQAASVNETNRKTT